MCYHVSIDWLGRYFVWLKRHVAQLRPPLIMPQTAGCMLAHATEKIASKLMANLPAISLRVRVIVAAARPRVAWPHGPRRRCRMLGALLCDAPPHPPSLPPIRDAANVGVQQLLSLRHGGRRSAPRHIGNLRRN